MEAKSPARSFVYGGLASAFAEALTIPLDVLKVRMQLQGEGGRAVYYRSTFDAAVKIFRAEGPSAFIKGLKPAVVRQLTYGSLRFGMYQRCRQLFGVPAGSTVAVPARKAMAAVTAGSSAAFICSPIDLIKVRMQAQGMRLSNDIPAYRGIVDAAVTIRREEGMLALYKGVSPATVRAGVVAAAEMATYDEVKCSLLRHGMLTDGIPLHLTSAVVSGLIASLASSPFDVAKSRLMSQPFDDRGVGLHYSGMVDCFRKSFRTEGWRFAYRGFLPTCCNKCPTVVLLFVFYEQVKHHGDRFLDG